MSHRVTISSLIPSSMQFSLLVRVKLNALVRHRVLLKARLEQLRGSGSSPLEAERKLKGGIFNSLEDAVMELRMAASKSLDTATAKLEMVDVTGYEMIGPLVRRITDLFVEVNKAQDTYVSLERISVSGNAGELGAVDSFNYHYCYHSAFLGIFLSPSFLFSLSRVCKKWWRRGIR